jgi:hypothetical protein
MRLDPSPSFSSVAPLPRAPLAWQDNGLLAAQPPRPFAPALSAEEELATRSRVESLVGYAPFDLIASAFSALDRRPFCGQGPSREDWLAGRASAQGDASEPLAHRAARSGDAKTALLFLSRGAPFRASENSTHVWDAALRADRGETRVRTLDALLDGGLPVFWPDGSAIRCSYNHEPLALCAAKLLDHSAGSQRVAARLVRMGTADPAAVPEAPLPLAVAAACHTRESEQSEAILFMETLAERFGSSALDVLDEGALPALAGASALLVCVRNGLHELAEALVGLGAGLDAVFTGGPDAGRDAEQLLRLATMADPARRGPREVLARLEAARIERAILDVSGSKNPSNPPVALQPLSSARGASELAHAHGDGETSTGAPRRLGPRL